MDDFKKEVLNGQLALMTEISELMNKANMKPGHIFNSTLTFTYTDNEDLNALINLSVSATSDPYIIDRETGRSVFKRIYNVQVKYSYRYKKSDVSSIFAVSDLLDLKKEKINSRKIERLSNLIFGGMYNRMHQISSR